MPTIAELEAELATLDAKATPAGPSLADLESELAALDARAAPAGAPETPREKSLLEKSANVARDVRGGLEAGLTVGTGLAASAIAGVGGLGRVLASPLTGQTPQEIKAQVEGQQKFLTYNPRTKEGLENLQGIASNETIKYIGDTMTKWQKQLGDAGFEAGNDSPLMGMLGTLIPDLALEVATLGLGQAPAQIAKQLAKVPEKLSEGAVAVTRGLAEGGPATDIAKTLSKGEDITPGDVSRIVDPDVTLQQAGKQLDVELPATVLSKSEDFQALGQGIQQQPLPGAIVGAVDEIAAVQKEITSKLTTAIDDAIKKTPEEVDAGYKAGIKGTLEQSEKAVDDAYTGVRQNLTSFEDAGGKVRIDAPNTVKYLEDLAAGLKTGEAELGAELQKILTTLKPTVTKAEGKIIDPATGKVTTSTETIQTTYGSLERVRRAVGNRFKDGSGDLAKIGIDDANALYSVLKQDKDAALKQIGGDELVAQSKQADELFQKQLNLMKERERLIGKPEVTKTPEGDVVVFKGELMKTVKANFNDAIKSGTFDKLDNVFKAVPKEQLGEVKGLLAQDIINMTPKKALETFDKINSSSRMRETFYKGMPEGIRPSLKAYQKVLGKIETMAKKTNKGQTDAFFRGKEAGLTGKLKTVLLIQALSKVTKVPWIILSGVVRGGKPPLGNLEKATTLLNSGQLTNFTNKVLDDGIKSTKATTTAVKVAEKALEKSRAFKAWSNTLGPDQKTQLKRVGAAEFFAEISREAGEGG